MAKGTTTIKAALQGVEGTTTVTVTNAVLTSIAVTPTAPSLAKGTSQSFVAMGTYSDNSTQRITTQVTWSSSNTAVGTVSNVTGSEGKVYAITKGTTTIKAALSGVEETTTLTVTDAVVMTIAVTPTTPSIAKGTTIQFKATATYSDTTEQNVTKQVTWSSSDTTVAMVFNATGSEGLATALADGTATIKAALPGTEGTTILTVTNAVLTSIAVTPTDSSIAKGTTQQFTATGTFDDQTTQDITSLATWTSTNTMVATVSNASGSKGLATATVEQWVRLPDKTTIEATFMGEKGMTSLTVTPPSLVSIDVTSPSSSIAKGTTSQFTATGIYSDQTTQNITNQVVWKSSNTSVATISNTPGPQGIATAVAGGITTITATLSNKTGSTSLIVTTATLVSIEITPQDPIPVGRQQQLTAAGSFSNNTTQDITTQVTWTSSETSVATISSGPNSWGGMVDAKIMGQTTIEAAFMGKTETFLLTVDPPSLDRIEVTPIKIVTIAPGATQQYTAMGVYSDNSTPIITDKVTWTSSDTNVATISNVAGSEGLATAVASGSGPMTIITATLDNKKSHGNMLIVK